MSVINVEEKDLSRVFQANESRRVDAVTRGIASAIMAGAEIVAHNAPKDQGALKQSVHGVPPDRDGSGGYIIVDAPYAGDVEMGTRPHWVPLRALIPWCIRHSTPEEGPRFARALQKKIAQFGTKPTYFMRKSLPVLKKILVAEIAREMKVVS